MTTTDDDKARRDAAWEAVKPSNAIAPSTKQAQIEEAWGQLDEPCETPEYFVMPRSKTNRPSSLRKSLRHGFY